MFILSFKFFADARVQHIGSLNTHKNNYKVNCFHYLLYHFSLKAVAHFTFISLLYNIKVDWDVLHIRFTLSKFLLERSDINVKCATAFKLK